jgi:cyclopropane-fatty-acyl-phospholipid synthase
MTGTEHTADGFSQSRAAGRDGLAGRYGYFLQRLHSAFRFGRLRLSLPTGHVFEVAGSEPGHDAWIEIVRWRALRRMAAGGDIGFAESYIDGDWTSPDLVGLIRLAATNARALSPVLGRSRLLRLVNRIGHLLRANSRKGSRKNIISHYDLGNEFYRQWLDPSMLYSSAIFEGGTQSLEAAQQVKLARIAELLNLCGGKEVLEIGFGWGALSRHLAETAGAQVTGVTLSPSQLAWASGVMSTAGLKDCVDLRLQDYRDVAGTFDRIVCIEMIEAVGEAYLPAYFEKLKTCLKPGGRAVLQVITIAEDRFAAYRRDTDFIQKHVFPGGFLPSRSLLSNEMERAGLTLTHQEQFGLSYARTLAEWRRRFDTSWPDIAAQGFEDRFRRLWEYYLSYCQAGFIEGIIDVGLYVIEHAPAIDS